MVGNDKLFESKLHDKIYALIKDFNGNYSDFIGEVVSVSLVGFRNYSMVISYADNGLSKRLRINDISPETVLKIGPNDNYYIAKDMEHITHHVGSGFERKHKKHLAKLKRFYGKKGI